MQPCNRTHRLLRVLAITLALGLATCETIDDPTLQTQAPDAKRIALLAFDLDAIAAVEPHADVSLEVDGVVVARVGLETEAGTLQGRVAWPLTPGAHRVSLILRSDRSNSRGDLGLILDADDVVGVRVERVDDTLNLQLVDRAHVSSDSGVTVDYRGDARPQAWQQRLGDAPLVRVAAMLADPQLSVVTPVTVNRAGVDGIGPLVAWQPTRETLRPPPLVVPALIRLYTYCTCGKPVPRRHFTLRTRAGEELQGRTDAFGLVHVRGAELASINYGRGQRKRKRAYAFHRGESESRANILRAIESSDPNEALTGLLDLRNEPLPAARKRLHRLLDHPNEVLWRNAGIALSHYDDLREEIAGRVRLLNRGIDAPRQLFLLGALRRPAGIGAVMSRIQHPTAQVRRMAAWALGFIGHRDGVSGVRQLLTDEDASVRAAAALALGRCGDSAGIEALETMQEDPNPEVQRRAAEGITLLQMRVVNNPEN